MFQHFRKLWGSGSETDSDSMPSDAPTIDPEQLEQLPSTDHDADELDAIYRQALDALDVVEFGVQNAAEELPQQESPEAIVENESTTTVEQGDGSDDFETSHPGVSPQQILEAALFVGGIDLTLKRLCQLLRDQFPPETVESFLDEWNTRYADEGRPYEIHFGEGGYRLSLRPEFEDVRNRVFGLGPREFKLSQEALEVLSLIAYQQPIEADRIVELRGHNPSGLLRQLLRRQLISLERDGEEKSSVSYRTTPRFLQAFGLATLDDLPQAEDLAFK